MSFQFSFDFEEDDTLAASAPNDLNEPSVAPSAPGATKCEGISLQSLIDDLPPRLSYTPRAIPGTSSGSVWSRDLFDARFQLLADGEDGAYDDAKEEEEGGDSDLVKGVYEGGLKTWECAMDLIQHLASTEAERTYAGRSTFEVGCGTALPSCYVFSRVLKELDESKEQGKEVGRTTIELLDFNPSVLRLITLPNMLLAYAQHLSLTSTLIASSPRSSVSSEDGEADTTELPSERPGDLELSPELVNHFMTFLEERKVGLKFWAGDWAAFPAAAAEAEEGHKWDLLLSSETIYSVPSLPSLVRLLRSASTEAEVLVAAKRMYFGVGGGERELRDEVERQGGEVEEKWSTGQAGGVGRGVWSLSFATEA